MPASDNPKIRFSCPSCGRSVNAPVSAVGKTAKCPGCEKAITIPQASTTPSIQLALSPAQSESTPISTSRPPDNAPAIDAIVIITGPAPQEIISDLAAGIIKAGVKSHFFLERDARYVAAASFMQNKNSIIGYCVFIFVHYIPSCEGKMSTEAVFNTWQQRFMAAIDAEWAPHEGISLGKPNLTFNGNARNSQVEYMLTWKNIQAGTCLLFIQAVDAAYRKLSGA